MRVIQATQVIPMDQEDISQHEDGIFDRPQLGLRIEIPMDGYFTNPILSFASYE